MINRKKIVIISIIVIIIFSMYFFRERENIGEIDNLNIYEENIEMSNNISTKDEIKENKIVVYITGAIKNEGVYEIKENSRIADIIEVAGGLTDEADIKNINLASVLDDGVKIYIPKINDSENEIIDNINSHIYKEDNSYKSTNYNKIKSKININSASQTELECLPGIGTSTAKKIIDYRKENGKFNRIEDIKKVSGIGESKFEKIKELIKV